MSERLSLGPHDSLENVSSTEEAFEVDGEERELEAGAEIEIGRGQVHQMWNPGSEPARVRWVTTPAGRTEEWFRVLDGLFREGGDIAAGREVDFGVLLEEYGAVFRLAQ
jgi:hypothetical protein